MLRVESMAFSTKPLSVIKHRKPVLIKTLQGEENFRFRLQEYGFIPGAWVSIDSVIGFGDPVAYSIQGGKVVLRKEDARYILVEE